MTTKAPGSKFSHFLDAARSGSGPDDPPQERKPPASESRSPRERTRRAGAIERSPAKATATPARTSMVATDPGPELRPERRGPGRPRGKRSDPEFVQTTAHIRRQTHRAVKIALLQEGQGREFSQLVEELLGTWLRDRA